MDFAKQIKAPKKQTDQSYDPIFGKLDPMLLLDLLLKKNDQKKGK